MSNRQDEKKLSDLGSSRRVEVFGELRCVVNFLGSNKKKVRWEREKKMKRKSNMREGERERRFKPPSLLYPIRNTGRGITEPSLSPARTGEKEWIPFRTNNRFKGSKKVAPPFVAVSNDGGICQQKNTLCESPVENFQQYFLEKKLTPLRIHVPREPQGPPSWE